jgi:DNA (cytosine-5)-methyltransferase 1
MFPEVARAVRQIRPKAIFIENVRGLLRKSFSKYFGYILLQLSYPEVIRKADEYWTEHLSRLEKYHTRGLHDGLCYRVIFRLLNAADYGVPQRRERVFIIGFRGDTNIEWSFPEATHSFESLLWSQWATGEYWEKHGVSKRERGETPSDLEPRIERLKYSLFPPGKKPWLTIRDAISDLPDPETNKDTHIQNHEFRSGARVYPGHTGSPLDEPAKTLKAGDHGVPGGENMLLLPNGNVRYFTVRESARLQTFPDDYRFFGSWTENMRQLGNAVPVKLANLIAKSVKERLRHGNFTRRENNVRVTV